MKTGFLDNTIKTISWFFILTILIYAGVFLYVRWDLERFEESLAKLSIVSSELLLQLDPEGLEREIEAPSLEAFDFLVEVSLFSEIELSEEKTDGLQNKYIQEEAITKADEFQVNIGGGSGFKGLISIVE